MSVVDKGLADGRCGGVLGEHALPGDGYCGTLMKGHHHMDEKTKEMIAIGTSVGAHCQPCLEYHVNKAREVGLTDDEIREAITVGHRVEKGAMSAMRQFSCAILDTNAAAQADGRCCGPAERAAGCCG